MKKGMKLFLISVALLIGGRLLVYLLSVTVFATIFNAIMGNPVSGIYATNVFMRICLPVINGLGICIPHARDAEARREFLDMLGADKYDRKADFKAIAKTKQFRNECIVLQSSTSTCSFFLCHPSGSFLRQSLFFRLSICGTIRQYTKYGQASAFVWQKKNKILWDRSCICPFCV